MIGREVVVEGYGPGDPGGSGASRTLQEGVEGLIGLFDLRRGQSSLGARR